MNLVETHCHISINFNDTAVDCLWLKNSQKYFLDFILSVFTSENCVNSVSGLSFSTRMLRKVGVGWLNLKKEFIFLNFFQLSFSKRNPLLGNSSLFTAMMRLKVTVFKVHSILFQDIRNKCFATSAFLTHEKFYEWKTSLTLTRNKMFSGVAFSQQRIS